MTKEGVIECFKEAAETVQRYAPEAQGVLILPLTQVFIQLREQEEASRGPQIVPASNVATFPGVSG